MRLIIKFIVNSHQLQAEHFVGISLNRQWYCRFKEYYNRRHFIANTTKSM